MAVAQDADTVRLSLAYLLVNPCELLKLGEAKQREFCDRGLFEMF